MKQKMDPLGEMRMKLIPIVLILFFICLLSFYVLESIPSNIEGTPEIPEFIFSNVGPCLEDSQDIVEMFEVGYSQYICGEMKSTELPVYLELHIYTSDKEKQVYVDGWTFNKNGSISFPIIPTLPPGKYWAYISWARPALIEFEFDVVK